ncbi:RNA polymerase sigma factor [Plantactinospora solaniradicis]|uniref:RNA polymerase sigma factor n=1 Tax=Plantactinospora solaniradicis TaxID=1723736 RepID=A0ABW1KEA4_9ACTN
MSRRSSSKEDRPDPGEEDWQRVEKAWRAHYAALAAHAYQTLRDPDEAEDVAQEALLQYAFHRGPIDNPLAWLRRVAHNRAVDRVRAKTRECPTDPENIRPNHCGADAEKRVELAETIQGLVATPDGVRTALVMAAEGQSGDAIAKRIGTNPVNTRQLISRAREELRRLTGRGKPSRDNAHRDGRTV